MKSTQHSTVVGVFETRSQADRAVDELRRVGFRNDQISFVARDAKGSVKTQGAPKEETYAEEGAVAGAIAGAGIGGLVGLGILAGTIPVIGPAIAAGTLGTILLNAAGGAAIAGVAGALIGLGIPEEEAKYYESELKTGRYIVTVHADGRHDEAWTILQRHGAYNHLHKQTSAASGARTGAAASSTYATASPAGARSSAAAAGTYVSDEQSMQLHEEQLRAHKQPVQAGEVRVRKDVVTEHKTLDVPVQREEVVIERHPASGRQASSTDLRPGQEIRIPVKEEQVRVEKENVVKEEVTVGKRKVQETQKVSDNVRKEQVHVEREGEVKVRGSGAEDIKSTTSRKSK